MKIWPGLEVRIQSSYIPLCHWGWLSAYFQYDRVRIMMCVGELWLLLLLLLLVVVVVVVVVLVVVVVVVLLLLVVVLVVM
jgi:hypothetical protein